MNWNMDKERPICPQLCELVCVGISNGEFPPGSRLLSVRDLAVVAGINPNTVQKSFTELERLGLIYSVRGTGWFVGENTALAKETVCRIAENKTVEYVSEMKKLGMTADEIYNYIKENNV